MFPNEPRVRYEKNQIVSVVCQLRFPAILAISAREPVEFQEAVRKEFPRYLLKKEQLPPRMVNRGGVVTAEKQDEVLNHTFVSASGSWTINLTDRFISLSAPSYTDWETFAGKLDRVLAALFQIYQPSYFERVGLRYVNAFSKKELGVEHLRWRDLIQPAYAGLLNEDDVQDPDFLRCTQDAELRVRGGCRAKLHAGPGMIKRGGMQDPHPRFILDIDVYMSGQIQPGHLTGALQTVHLNADSIFRGAITDELHEAMLPLE